MCLPSKNLNINYIYPTDSEQFASCSWHYWGPADGRSWTAPKIHEFSPGTDESILSHIKNIKIWSQLLRPRTSRSRWSWDSRHTPGLYGKAYLTNEEQMDEPIFLFSDVYCLGILGEGVAGLNSLRHPLIHFKNIWRNLTRSTTRRISNKQVSKPRTKWPRLRLIAPLRTTSRIKNSCQLRKSSTFLKLMGGSILLTNNILKVSRKSSLSRKMASLLINVCSRRTASAANALRLKILLRESV